MEIEEMIRRKRELGYTDEVVARLSGVPVSTVRKVFGGVTKSPRQYTVEALEETLKKDRAAHFAELDPREAEVRRAFWKGEEPKETDLPLSGGRSERIDGIHYESDPVRVRHQIIAGQIYTTLLDYLAGEKMEGIPFLAPVDVLLPDEEQTIVQPDVALVCDRSKCKGSRIVGEPDFIAEVISEKTRRRDMYLKLTKYQETGVREYWMVDPDRETVVTYAFENGDAVRIYSFREQAPLTIFHGECVVDFARIDDFLKRVLDTPS